MHNPWEQIGLGAYEAHMQSAGVMQSQMLNRITREQLRRYRPASVALLGAAGGNGLEHVDPSFVEKVWAIDINREYLEACGSRFRRLGPALETVHRDLSAPDAALPAADLAICNLIVEYLGIGVFTALIARTAGTGVVSCVIQKDKGDGFVSASALARSFDCLEPLHRTIREQELTCAMAGVGYGRLLRRVYALPNAKEFIRLDFSRFR